jgi:hypothetical protein
MFQSKIKPITLQGSGIIENKFWVSGNFSFQIQQGKLCLVTNYIDWDNHNIPKANRRIRKFVMAIGCE